MERSDAYLSSYSHAFESRQGFQRTQGSECPHRFKCRNIGDTHPIQHTAENTDHDNDEVEPVPAVRKVFRDPIGEPFQDQLDGENHSEDLIQDNENGVKDRLLPCIDVFQCLEMNIRDRMKANAISEKSTYERGTTGENTGDD